MKEKFKQLAELGAGDFQHLNGSLTEHLKGTQNILKQWGASDVLQTAGLFHAAYGTAGFDENMVSLDQRKYIAEIIGEEEEALVYLYCSCDRDHVFPQFNKEKSIKFRDRFNETSIEIDDKTLNLFCELTVANELELVLASDDFKKQYGEELLELFRRMDAYLSPQAVTAYREALSDL
ncbi:DUF6817 domain-containing protein [Vibrio nigripulchritudo]|uniref:DUF6817 domain-containing protein n=1 Tax=Vibrio nigripulchritudo TaxID=28173 RepID=UPI0005FA8CAB|nr:hypothetical protein [Vibrio nigripulchritudo]KJY73688.1 hypothetical protein TW74_20375 [Vibrio nigripulchritudo]